MDTALLATFNDEAKRVKAARLNFPSKERLELYSYYKQATEGDAPLKERSNVIFRSVLSKTKHESWSDRRGMSKNVAQAKYIQLAQELLGVPSYPSQPADGS